MSLPPFYNPDDSPYRPATADSTWTSAGIEGGNSSTGVGYSSGITSNLTTGDGPAVNDTSLTNSNMGQFKQDFPVLSLSGRHAQFQRPDQLQTLQPTVASGSHMGMFMSSNATTPRQSNFPRDQVDRTPQQSGPTLQQDAANVAPSEPLRLGYMPGSDTGASQQASMSAAQRYASWAWNSAPSHFTTTSAAYGRPMYTGMPMSTSLPPSEALMGMSTSHLGFDATSSTHTSPQRMPHPYESAASHMGAPSSYGYGYYGVGSASSSASSSSKSLIPQQDGYVPMGQLEYSAGDIDSMLGQVSTLYKNANTKKMAEFYRDKWARIWLTCNYGLKPSIQISIPRTILHESYRRTCESFGLEPLQAASFGKVLRSQFPDVAQRRLGGRGKTRFHYCGFGTSNEREAFQVKSLLEDEKAGRLQLSAGISAEFANESKSKAKSEGHEPDASSSSSVLAASAAATRQQRSLSFATSGSSSTSANTPMASGPLTMGDDRMAASAFATLNSAVSNTVSTLPGAGTPSSGTQDSFQQTLPPSFPGSGGNGGMPRRHTVSHSGPGPNDVAFLPNLTSQPHASAFSFGSGVGSGVGAGLPGSSAYDTSFGSGSQTEDHSSFASQLNSPASSLHAYYHGHGNEQRGDVQPIAAGPLASFQTRRRDDSMGSSISDSHYTWMSGDQAYSSSASESELSMQSQPGPMLDAPPGSTNSAASLPAVYAPTARKWSSGGRLRMTSTRSSAASEASGSISGPMAGLALATQGQAHSLMGSPAHMQGQMQQQNRNQSSRATPTDSPHLGQSDMSSNSGHSHGHAYNYGSGQGLDHAHGSSGYGSMSSAGGYPGWQSSNATDAVKIESGADTLAQWQTSTEAVSSQQSQQASPSLSQLSHHAQYQQQQHQHHIQQLQSAQAQSLSQAYPHQSPT